MFGLARPLESTRLMFFKLLEVLTVSVYPDTQSRNYLLVVIEVEVLSAGGPLSLVPRDRDQKLFFTPSKAHEISTMNSHELLRVWYGP